MVEVVWFRFVFVGRRVDICLIRAGCCLLRIGLLGVLCSLLRLHNKRLSTTKIFVKSRKWLREVV